MPIAADDAIYTGVVTADNGREGMVVSNDGRLELLVSQPAEARGSGGVGSNPEQLFAATYAACFHASLAVAAGRAKAAIAGSKVTAHVGIGPGDDGRFGIVARLVVDLPALDQSTANALVERAHEICPYSRMTREGINVAIDVSSSNDASGRSV